MEKSFLERFSEADSADSPIGRVVLCMNFGDPNDVSSDGEVLNEIKDEIISFLEEDDTHFVAICGINWGGAAKLYSGLESHVKSAGLASRLWHPVPTIPKSIHDCDENTRWYWLGDSIDGLLASDIWMQACDGYNEIASQVLKRMTVVVSSWYMSLAVVDGSGKSVKMTYEHHQLLSLLNYNQLKFEQRWSKDQLEKIKSKWLENKVALNPEICSKCGCLSHPMTVKAAWQVLNRGRKPQYWPADCGKVFRRILLEVCDDGIGYLVSNMDSERNNGIGCPYFLEHAVLKENEGDQNEES